METNFQILFLFAFLETVSCQFDLFALGGGMNGLGGMGGMNLFNPFGGGAGMDMMGFRNAFAPPAAPVPDPAAMREARLTTSEEQLGELLTESAKTDPGRQRVERLLQRSGGRFTGEAAPLNYLVQEYYMTTPGPIPPPNPVPNRNRFSAGMVNNARGGMSMGPGPQMGPNTQSFQRPQMGPGPATAPRNTRMGRPSRRRQGRNQARTPATTAIPDWEQWLIGSQAGGRGPTATRNNPGPRTQQGPPPRNARPPMRQRGRNNANLANQHAPQRNAMPPARQGGPPPPQRPQNRPQQSWQSQNNQPPAQNSPPKNPPSTTSKASNAAGQRRTSIAVERLKNIQRRIDNLLKSQSGAQPGSANQQLDALRQIRDILSGKMLKPMGRATQAVGPPAKTNSGPPPQAQPAYETQPAQPPQGGPVNNNRQSLPPPPGYEVTQHQPNQLNMAGPSPPAGTGQGRGVGPMSPTNQHQQQQQQQQQQQPVVTTAAPKLGDVRYMGNAKYVYTDADGFDVFQWVKVTDAPPQEHQHQQGQSQQQQQQGQQQQQQEQQHQNQHQQQAG